MKKIISILLAAVIMCSFTMFAFAADDDEITVGNEYTFTVKNGKTVDMTFIAKETAVYKIDFAFKDPSAVLNSEIHLSVFYKNNIVTLASVEKFDKELFEGSLKDLLDIEKLENEVFFVGEKNKPFTLEFSGASLWQIIDELDDTVELTVKLSKADVPELKIGNTYDSQTDHSVYYVYPEADTTYNITSDFDTMEIEINDINGSVDYYGFYKEDVNYTFRLEGGKFYAIAVSAGEGKVPFDFKVNDGANVLPEEIVADDLYVLKGDYEYLFYSVYPIGSTVNSDGLSITVGNEKIAKVEYDDCDGCTVHGLKTGKTTLTVTDKTTGTSTTCNVVVISPFVSFITGIPYIISAFFFNIIYSIRSIFGFGE